MVTSLRTDLYANPDRSLSRSRSLWDRHCLQQAGLRSLLAFPAVEEGASLEAAQILAPIVIGGRQ